MAEENNQNQQPVNEETEKTKTTESSDWKSSFEAIEAKLDGIMEKKNQNIPKKILTDNGFEDSEVQEILSRYRESKERKKSESTETITNLTAENAQLRQQILDGQIKSVATQKALTMGVDDATIQYVTRLADFTKATKDGKIDETLIEEALKKVLDDLPQLKSTEKKKEGFKKVGGDGDDEKDTSADDKLRKAFGL